MGSKVFLLLGLLFPIFLLISAEVAARDLAETSTTVSKNEEATTKTNEADDTNYTGNKDGFPGFGVGDAYPGGTASGFGNVSPGGTISGFGNVNPGGTISGFGNVNPGANGYGGNPFTDYWKNWCQTYVYQGCDCTVNHHNGDFCYKVCNSYGGATTSANTEVQPHN
ncbi:GRP domain-containing protein [Cephalotus follicularis]|uniref:GRP domain-containing protein n=1 Tax=Cephalotus follicularis TaxID=3775 RepID=A0A1Q3C348_CEPFO|nr:GRP domain-containing protein [Cephalotus follicularis]